MLSETEFLCLVVLKSLSAMCQLDMKAVNRVCTPCKFTYLLHPAAVWLKKPNNRFPPSTVSLWFVILCITPLGIVPGQKTKVRAEGEVSVEGRYPGLSTAGPLVPGSTPRGNPIIGYLRILRLSAVGFILLRV